MTLEEIKDKYAKEHGFKDFDALSWRMGIKEDYLNEIAKRYASAKLAEAAEKATLRKGSPSHSQGLNRNTYNYDGGNYIQVDKASITAIPLD